MSEFKDWLQSDSTRDLGEGVQFLDADTLRTDDGLPDVRLQGVSAPETAKYFKGDWGEAGGFETAEQTAKLAKSMGFTHVKRTGVFDDFGREEGDLINPKTGESFKTRLLQEGIVPVHAQYDRTGLQQAADYGAFMRTAEGQPETEWDKARLLIEEAMLDNRSTQQKFRQAQASSGDWQVTVDYLVNQLGMDEEAAKAVADKRYNKDVAHLEYTDRDIATGKSNNPLSDAWDVGIIGVQESMWGIVDLLGEQIDSEYLTTHGKTGVQRARNRIGEQGRLILDYKDVDGFWDAIEYVGNNAAISLPYMGISIAGALAAPVTGGLSLTAPAAVYTGQTWNEMEGDKNAAVAIGSGVMQAALDRLGIGLIFKAGKPVKATS